MTSLRDSLNGDQLPEQCNRCDKARAMGQDSMLDVGERDVDKVGLLPSRYQIAFSNVCNIGCWSCYEGYSSVIQEEKRKLNILPEGYVDPTIAFNNAWPGLKETIFKSYDEHDSILINVFGGEPTISKEFVEFLQELVDRNLNGRTRIEMFTNCQNPRPGFQKVLKNNVWEHINILASIDAIGSANDWIRYGSDWKSVETNLRQLRDIADHIEIISTLSVLNAKLLPEMKRYCINNSIHHTTQILTEPWFMSVLHWDGPIDLLGRKSEYEDVGYGDTWNQFKSQPRSGSHKALIDYINQFDRRSDQILEDLLNSYS